MSSHIIFIVFLFVCVPVCYGSRILAIIPSALYTHQAVFRPLWQELSLRGHQITLVTSHPMKNKSLTNITEIDISVLCKFHQKIIAIFGDDRSMFEKGRELYEQSNNLTRTLYTLPGIQNLLHNTSEHFDLVVTEALYPVTTGFSWHFKCPWIGVASLDVGPPTHGSMGNPTHPVLLPDFNTPIEDYDNLSFGERIQQTIFYVMAAFFTKTVMYPNLRENLVKYFGPEMPALEEIDHNMSMLFLNINPLTHAVRPLSPNTIMIGSGIHINAPKKLPKDIEKFLDDGKDGVVYFSLGSNVGSNFVNEEMRQIFIDTFKALPFRVLWKFDIELENLPPNVKISKWLPQQDILRHRYVKLFITQGGLQSLEETLILGVPFVGIPFYGDQFHNVRRLVKQGAGLEVKRRELDSRSLETVIKDVISNPKYKEKARQLGELLRDRPLSGIEEAVWWTEYVLRHKGAKHLKNDSANIALYKYFLLDVIGFLFLAVLAIFVPIYLCMKWTLRKIYYKRKVD